MYAYEDCQAEQEQGLSFVDSLIESTKEYLTPEVITTGIMGFFALCVWCASNGRIVDFKLGTLSMKVL